MSRYQAIARLNKIKHLGTSANILLGALFLFTTIGAGGQVAEVSAAAKGIEVATKVADLAATKDFIWLILFICGSLVWVVFVLVNAVLKQAKDSSTSAVETAQAIQRLCDLIEDQTPLSHDRSNRKPANNH